MRAGYTLSIEILKRFNFHGHVATAANGFATKRRAFLAANMLAAVRRDGHQGLITIGGLLAQVELLLAPKV